MSAKTAPTKPKDDTPAVAPDEGCFLSRRCATCWLDVCIDELSAPDQATVRRAFSTLARFARRERRPVSPVQPELADEETIADSRAAFLATLTGRG